MGSVQLRVLLGAECKFVQHGKAAVSAAAQTGAETIKDRQQKLCLPDTLGILASRGNKGRQEVHFVKVGENKGAGGSQNMGASIK